MSVVTRDGDGLWLWCPACQDIVRIVIGPAGWTWDGDLEQPTITPSILTHEALKADGTVHRPRCHSFVTAGVWDYLSDSTHHLAGQRVLMREADLPDWLTHEFTDQ